MRSAALRFVLALVVETVEVLRAVHVQWHRTGHEHVGDVEVVHELTRPLVACEVVEQAWPGLARDGDGMAHSVGVLGASRVRAILQGGHDLADRLRVDPGLVRQQHDGDPGVVVTRHRVDPGPHRGGLPRHVLVVDHDLDVVAVGDRVGDREVVVTDDHDATVDAALPRGVEHVDEQRLAVELRQRLRPAETAAGPRGEHHGDRRVRWPLIDPPPPVGATVRRTTSEVAVAADTDTDAVLDRRWSAAVVTSSDGVAYGHRDDGSGDAVAHLLEDHGFSVVARRVVPDERGTIAETLRELASEDLALVAITGGTGFGPRDVTPEATRDVIEREAPGLAEAMRASGRTVTPMADLSRGVCGVLGRTLIVDLPGSPRGATESLSAVMEVLPHALDLLAGDTQHHPPGHGDEQHRPPGHADAD